MTIDRSSIEPLYFLLSFLKFYVLDIVTSLSDWTPNGKFFGVYKSSVNPKDPPNISPPPEYKPNKNANGPL